ncbi:hypothetical protein F4604DRAFT_18832 [Suillus subluteus]|nr:hypothetical protein F4604DRAFT_18832 [Suillus subluteus]
MKFEVVWKSSHYHSDGRRRSRPKASTFHGWLVKWRATFSGNEHLRGEGMREMREAKAMREYKRQQKAAKRAKNGRAKPGLFSRFSFGNPKTRRALRPGTLARDLAQFSQEQQQPTSGPYEDSNQSTTYKTEFTSTVI